MSDGADLVVIKESDGILPVAFDASPPERNPALIYLASLAPGSRRTMRQSLEIIADLVSGDRGTWLSIPWADLRYAHTTAIRAKLSETYAPATANKIICAMKGVIKEAWRLGLMSGEDYMRAVDVSAVKGTRLPAGRSLNSGELRSLCQVCDEDPSIAGRRDAAVLSLLYGAGLRRSEAVAVRVQDYDHVTGGLVVISGKGNKSRQAYLTNGAKSAIDAWIAVRGAEPGPLLFPVSRMGRVVVRQMTDQALLYIMRRRAVEAGVKCFSPHDLRRSFVSDLLDSCVDINTVKELAGHSNQ